MSGKWKLAYGPVMFVAGLIGITLFCTVHALFSAHDILELITGTTYVHYTFELAPIWLLTPLYIVPILAGLLYAERLGVAGLIFITLAVTIAHYLAQTLGTKTFLQFSIHNGWGILIAGLIGGIVGSTVPFLAFTLLAHDLRDRAHIKLYGIFIVILALVGALSFFIPAPKAYSEKWILNLYLPWQMTFAFAIAKIFYNRKT